MVSLERLRSTSVEHAIDAAAKPVWCGEVENVSGVVVEATGVPAAVGELVRISIGSERSILAEVVGFRGTTTLLMPHDDTEGIAPQQKVTALGRSFSVPVGPGLVGRVLDGLARPIDGGPTLSGGARGRRVKQPAPPPMSRPPIRTAMQTGVRAIDGFTTMGRGQRLGVFAGSGVGKSTLLGQIAAGTDADVLVIALVGERGREVREFLDETLDPATRGRAVTVVATSDRPPIERFLAPFTAITIAEAFRDEGKDVLLVMDSVTRFALASREIGLAAGEPPTVRGFPPSFFATLPKLVERLGSTESGSITGVLTVLLDGDDPNEPVADTLRGLLDGHLFLSRDLAHQGHFPAIDVLSSLSRLMPQLSSPEHIAAASKLRNLMAAWAEGKDLVEIGAYRAGTNPTLDKAIQLLPAINAFLRQGTSEHSSTAETLELLNLVANS